MAISHVGGVGLAAVDAVPDVNSVLKFRIVVGEDEVGAAVVRRTFGVGIRPIREVGRLHVVQHGRHCRGDQNVLRNKKMIFKTDE
jgi:hypothetical protein